MLARRSGLELHILVKRSLDSADSNSTKSAGHSKIETAWTAREGENESGLKFVAAFSASLSQLLKRSRNVRCAAGDRSLGISSSSRGPYSIRTCLEAKIVQCWTLTKAEASWEGGRREAGCGEWEWDTGPGPLGRDGQSDCVELSERAESLLDAEESFSDSSVCNFKVSSILRMAEAWFWEVASRKSLALVIAELRLSVEARIALDYESLNDNLKLVLLTRVSKWNSHPKICIVYPGRVFYLLCDCVL